MITQQEITLPPFPRGFHIITDHIVQQLDPLPEQGILHVFIKHTSASICINENADPAVRRDLESAFNKIAPENEPYYTHLEEGPDDMPSHIKSAMIGTFVSIPISKHRLNLGTWQGIFLCEFRNRAAARKLVLTVYS